jgi:hypothetical protein
MTTGIVMGIEKNAVRLLDVEGNWHNLNPVHLTASIDTRCKDLEAMAPEAREEACAEYIEVWELRHTTEENEDGEVVSRKRSSSGGRIGDVIRFIEGSKARVKKSDIMAGVELTDAEYMHAVRNLLSAKRINQEGKRRGASYGIPGREYEAVEATQKAVAHVDISEIIQTIKYSTTPMSRSDLRAVHNFTDAEWIEISAALKNSPHIVVTGKKRGTRYAVK